MATIQAKKTNGHKYWYIVESRRINGKPRPIVLEYLGKVDDLLKRLQGLTEGIKLKTYSHGLVSVLLDIAVKLDICSILNTYVSSARGYTAEKPIRNHLTAGATLMLAAIGRACTVTSKDSWAEWARTTSVEYLLRANFSKIDSQHFWDCMDSFPIDKIENAELEILIKVFEQYQIKLDSLFYDTTNFYTYISTTNSKCEIAKRGKNKQKRDDLRQIGLALVVTKDTMIPLFHHSYEGNLNDSKVFKGIIERIRDRLKVLGDDIKNHTIIFDRGNNSRKNIALIESMHLNYVGALTPSHHKELVFEASGSFQKCEVDDKFIYAYRTYRKIWDTDMTVVVLISDKLQDGQIRGLYTSLSKCDRSISDINEALSKLKPGSKKRNREQIEKKVQDIICKYKLNKIVEFEALVDDERCFGVSHNIRYDLLSKMEEAFGYRIIMTNRHEWSTPEIIQAYHGQSFIENTFKNMKNQKHLSFNPQFHWTDQKIIVHNFCCVIGYLLSTIAFKIAKDKGFKGTMDSFLDSLSKIRLGTILESTNKKGRPKAVYKLEEMETNEQILAEHLNITHLHENVYKPKGFSVYT